MALENSSYQPRILSGRCILVLALFVWCVATLLRLAHYPSYSGVNFDDVAYGTSGKELIQEGHCYWGDCWRPFAAWWVAFFHVVRGISITNVGLAFATLRSLGALLLIFASRRLFPRWAWTPLLVAVISESSFLGASYGKQHLSSLLFSGSLGILAYSYYLDTGKWRYWVGASICAGLVFLSHFNTIAALAIMLGLELLRKILERKSLAELALSGVIGVVGAFGTVLAIGKYSYQFANWFTYLKRVWTHMTTNQLRESISISPSDSFLLTMASWEGPAFALYIAAICWWSIQMWRKPSMRRYIALVGLPLIGCGLVFIRTNLGFLSFPRLYVFALPFLWVVSAGMAGAFCATYVAPRSLRFQWILALGISLAAIWLEAGHQIFTKRFRSANSSLEVYLNAHPTNKIVMWAGNPHLSTFFFGWKQQPIIRTQREAENFWKAMGPEFARRVGADISNPANWAYLDHNDVAQVCDLVIVDSPSVNVIAAYDAQIKAAKPSVKIVNFYNGAILSPRFAAEDGVLTQEPSFSESTRLPIYRLYDFRSN